MRNTRHMGFTLVELLVVIGIIALLISILLPSLGKARAQAESVACLSNMRSMTQAVAIYQAEYKGSYPPSASTIDTNGSAPNYGMGTHWNGHIWTRLKLPQDGNARVCPTILGLLPNTPITTSYVKGAYASYTYNTIIGGAENNANNSESLPVVIPTSTGGTTWSCRPYRKMKFSSDVALFMDGATLYKVSTDYGDVSSDRGGQTTRLRTANISGKSWTTINGINRSVFINMAPVHSRKPSTALNRTIAGVWPSMQGYVNVAFCDGSVRSMFVRQGENGLSSTANAGMPNDPGDGVGNGVGLPNCQAFIDGVKFSPIMP